MNKFVSSLLKSENHSLSDSMKRLVLSYSCDIKVVVSRGKVVTLKQFLLGIGLHNITGLRAPIRILSHLGHCIDYNLVCEIETTKAEEAIKHFENMEIYMPSTDIELTYWWVITLTNLWRHKQDMEQLIQPILLNFQKSLPRLKNK